MELILLTAMLAVLSVSPTPQQAPAAPGNVRITSGSAAPESSGKGSTEKPPFYATPLTQKLSPNNPVTDPAQAIGTPNSQLGGYPGLTRSGGIQLHEGLDDQGFVRREPPKSSNWSGYVIARYTGTGEGRVVLAGDAFTSNREYLGKRVTIQCLDSSGTLWESTTMHHRELRVGVGQLVNPGTVIAVGAGLGAQFQSPNAGAPHVHWTLKRNGILVNPLNGKPLKPE